MTPPRPTVRRVDGPAAGPDAVIVTRPALEADLAACTRVWQAALSEYLERLNQPPVLADLEVLRRLLVHLRRTDPDRFRVAVSRAGVGGPGAGRTRRPPAGAAASAERVVGFASATVRGEVWFLAMLFVEPGAQARGLGQRLLDEVLAGADGLALGTATDSAQPISNALYARSGIVPRLPVLHLVGAVEQPAAVPALPEGIRCERLPSAGAAGPSRIDRAILGYEHPGDHAWLVADGRVGYGFLDPAGSMIGYGYISPSGRVGPVAALDRRHLAAFVTATMARARVGAVHSLWVPGAADEVVGALLRAGLRLEPFPALLCWTVPFADFGRYLPISLALL